MGVILEFGAQVTQYLELLRCNIRKKITEPTPWGRGYSPAYRRHARTRAVRPADAGLTPARNFSLGALTEKPARAKRGRA
jgi:hypothetical protein